MLRSAAAPQMSFIDVYTHSTVQLQGQLPKDIQGSKQDPIDLSISDELHKLVTVQEDGAAFSHIMSIQCRTRMGLSATFVDGNPAKLPKVRRFIGLDKDAALSERELEERVFSKRFREVFARDKVEMLVRQKVAVEYLLLRRIVSLVIVNYTVSILRFWQCPRLNRISRLIKTVCVI